MVMDLGGFRNPLFTYGVLKTCVALVVFVILIRLHIQTELSSLCIHGAMHCAFFLLLDEVLWIVYGIIFPGKCLAQGSLCWSGSALNRPQDRDSLAD